MSDEVAALKQQIAEEYQASKNGLDGLAYGTARHDFITSQMENMERYLVQLEGLVGQEKAKQIFNGTLITP